MTISARLVELMGGRIWAESPAPPTHLSAASGGGGSVFHFTVRFGVQAEVAVVDRHIIEVVTSRVALGSDARGQARRILLAEDNPVNQKVALHMLRRGGYDVTVVATGREAVDRVAREAFDLVLMDVQMPEMDGFAATAAIRRDLAGRHLPIVAMTAHSMAGDRERCLAAGMDAYISKPIRLADLFAVLERELEGQGPLANEGAA